MVVKAVWLVRVDGLWWRVDWGATLPEGSQSTHGFLVSSGGGGALNPFFFFLGGGGGGFHSTQPPDDPEGTHSTPGILLLKEDLQSCFCFILDKVTLFFPCCLALRPSLARTVP